MATSKAYTLSILLVLAVYVTQCIGEPDPSKSREAWDKLMDANSNLDPDEVWELLRTIHADPTMKEKELGHGLVVSEALYYGEYHFCDKSAMFELNKLYLQADQFNESLKNYLIHYYIKQIEYCEQIALRALLLFQNERPNLWKQFEELFNAIKSDDRLFANLDKRGFGMKKEAINYDILSDVLKKKDPNLDANYRGQAIRIIDEICEYIKKFTRDSGNPQRVESLEVVSMLSSSIERKREPPFDVNYLYLCERAREIDLLRKAQK